MTAIQQLVLRAKQKGLAIAQSTIQKVARLIVHVPADSSPFDYQTAGVFPAYPGAGVITTLLTIVVPRGQVMVLQHMAHINWGGGVVNGTGTVIWRWLVNGVAIDGLNNQTSEIGSWAQPAAKQIVLMENDVLTCTVECPAGGVAGTTAARADGYTFPLSKLEAQP